MNKYPDLLSYFVGYLDRHECKCTRVHQLDGVLLKLDYGGWCRS